MQMHPDIMQIVMFEVGERAEMEHNQNGHNLTVGKGGLATSTADADRGNLRLSKRRPSLD